MRVGEEAVAKLAALALILACSSGPARDAATGTDGKIAIDGGVFARMDGGVRDGIALRDMGVEVRNAEAGVARDLSSASDGRDSGHSDSGQDSYKAVDAAMDAKNPPTADGGGQSARDGTVSEASLDAVDGPAMGLDLDLAPPRPGTCANPIPIPLQTMHSELRATNVGADHLVDIPCAGNNADVVYSISVQDLELVYADTFGASWNTILFFSDTCPPAANGGEVTNGLDGCNDDACGTRQSQAVALLAYGRHYLILSGAQGESGEATIHLDRTLAGGGTLLPMPAGTGAVTGATSGLGKSGLCEAGGPEDTYWWTTCPDFTGGDFLATTCAGSSYDTVLALQIPRSGVVACNDDDDTCGRQSTLAAMLPPGAGLHTLLVDGQVGTSAGDYTLAYTRP